MALLLEKCYIVIKETHLSVASPYYLQLRPKCYTTLLGQHLSILGCVHVYKTYQENDGSHRSMISLVNHGKYFGRVIDMSWCKHQPVDTADSQWANCTTWWQLINCKVQILHWSIPSFIFCPSPSASNLCSIWTFEVFKSYPHPPPQKKLCSNASLNFLEKAKSAAMTFFTWPPPAHQWQSKALGLPREGGGRGKLKLRTVGTLLYEPVAKISYFESRG